MSERKSLLVELGTEELPVKALPGLAQAFFDGVLAALDRRGIGHERGDARPLLSSSVTSSISGNSNSSSTPG